MPANLNFPHYHCVVWIDHALARVFYFGMTDGAWIKATVRPAETGHLHHKAGEIGSGHAAEDKSYLADVAAKLDKAGAILILGPANEKLELAKYLQTRAPTTHAHVAGVEAFDHATDGELLDFARHYFQAADRMTPQR